MTLRPPLRIGVLGDDLTGLNAVLAEGADFGLRAVACHHSASPSAPDLAGLALWGIDLASRDGQATPALASTQVQRLLEWGADHIIFKVDSLWRGEPELFIEVASRFGQPVVFNGTAPPLASVAHVPHTNPLLAMAELQRHFAEGQRLWLGGLGLVSAILWSGLQTRLPFAAVVGSYQANVAAQLAAMAGLGATLINTARESGDTASAVTTAWRGAPAMVLQTLPLAGLSGVDAAAADATFERSAELLRPLLKGQPFGLLLTGGHTASTVLRTLGVQRLEVTGQNALEGAPILRASDSPFSKGLIVTKPGHFGGPDALVKIAIKVQLLAAHAPLGQS